MEPTGTDDVDLKVKIPDDPREDPADLTVEFLAGTGLLVTPTKTGYGISLDKTWNGANDASNTIQRFIASEIFERAEKCPVEIIKGDATLPAAIAPFDQEGPVENGVRVFRKSGAYPTDVPSGRRVPPRKGSTQKWRVDIWISKVEKKPRMSEKKEIVKYQASLPVNMRKHTYYFRGTYESTTYFIAMRFAPVDGIHFLQYLFDDAGEFTTANLYPLLAYMVTAKRPVDVKDEFAPRRSDRLAGKPVEPLATAVGFDEGGADDTI